MTGKLTPKPDDTHRKQLKKRAADHIALANSVIPKSMRKTPSQLKSERAVKREWKRANAHDDSCRAAATQIQFDCYTCPKNPCGVDPVACGVIMILERCASCGLPTRHYRDVNAPWVFCQSCREKRK